MIGRVSRHAHSRIARSVAQWQRDTASRNQPGMSLRIHSACRVTEPKFCFSAHFCAAQNWTTLSSADRRSKVWSPGFSRPVRQSVERAGGFQVPEVCEHPAGTPNRGSGEISATLPPTARRRRRISPGGHSFCPSSTGKGGTFGDRACRCNRLPDRLGCVRRRRRGQ